MPPLLKVGRVRNAFPPDTTLAGFQQCEYPIVTKAQKRDSNEQ